MDINVNILENENVKVGEVYHKKNKKNGNKTRGTLIHIIKNESGFEDWAYVIVNKKIIKIGLNSIEVI